MFVQPLDEQAIRLGSEITFLRQMAEQLQKQLNEANEKVKKYEDEKNATKVAEKETKQ